MKNLTALLVVLLLAATAATAAVSYYTDQAIFEGLYPGLTTEDYSATLVAPNSVASDFGPLNSATNNLLFAPGGIVDGFSFDNLDGGDNVVLTPPFLGVTAVTVGCNTFAHNSEYSFSVPVNAFAIEIVMPMAPGTIDIEIFGAGGSLGSTTASGALPGVFWGVFSDEDITRIEFLEPVTNGELFANAQFGEAGLALQNSTWGNIKTSF
ncbi:MAG: hypothetical protein KAR44_02575 [Candidatus Aegiribacteria sp.]|nr:hypothetical protein [Candidatus Aegiribacteria sp.]